MHRLASPSASAPTWQSPVSASFTWGNIRLNKTILLVTWTFALLLSLLAPSALLAAGPMTGVIVQESSDAGNGPENAVVALGGSVTRQLGIINGFAAEIPSDRLAVLAGQPGISFVTPDAAVRLNGVAGDGLGFDDASETSTLHAINRAIGSTALFSSGYTGRGIDVAIIDSGVAPLPELAGRIINGPDLSFESQVPNLTNLDTYGHGTHLAGIIAGRDPLVNPTRRPDYSHEDYFVGVAPESRIVSMKVAVHSGATDVSQIIAAIDWIVQHRNANGMNIRVLNLSFGTDGVQSYMLDPLAYAAEVAWRKGIVVVVSAGNSQFGSSAMNNPAYDPYVIAVGASEMNGTLDMRDDTLASFSAIGTTARRPDLVAPGRVASLRANGSYLDQAHPAARIGNYFRGAGTSQSAAIVSGAVALLLQQRPELTPDQVKYLLASTATSMAAPLGGLGVGSGGLNVDAASKAKVPFDSSLYVQTHPLATGLGSLEAARGTVHVADANGVLLTGEMDIFGAVWDGNTWSGNTWSGNTWNGGTWNGNTWSGNTWSGNTWSGNTWSGNTWSGNTWSGNTWSGNTWSGNTWSGNTWSGNTWSGNTWSGNTWSGNTWSGNTWSGIAWSGLTWD